MSANSKIEWTERTWNPVTGCTEVSPGCDHCYAKTFAERFRGVPGHAFENGFDLTFHPERLRSPFRWKKQSRVFVNSMSDLFHRDIPDEFIGKVYETMLGASLCPHRHTFQVLTKRPERMRRIVPPIYEEAGRSYRDGKAYIDGIWSGVSIEGNGFGWRAGMLREVPGIRWISFEPLLASCAAVDLTGIDWVVIGGESGHGARWMDPDWVREIILNARAVGAAVFVKQLGAVWSRGLGDRDDDGDPLWRADPKGGEMERWPEDLRVREYPAT
jgi:protein gp37